MSDLQTRAQQLHDAGRRTAYAIGYATVSDQAAATDLLICLGAQWSGRRLYMVDLDSHTAEQDATSARQAFRAARPELAAKLDWYRSKSGTGWHALFESSVQISTGKLYDQAGRHIGELLGNDSDRTLDPGNVRIPCLHIGEIERLLNVWHVKGSDPKGERWTDRAKQGEQWTRGAHHIPVTKKQLRTFLQNDAGPVGRQLDTYFDPPPPPPHKPPPDRSTAAGQLMQTLMLHAHKLPGCANAGFTTRCANVKAYWMAADSFGKASEKGYNQEKDGDSLIAQIVSGDPYGDDRRWTTPFWAKSHATATPAAAPEKAAPRPAHRPAGDREKHLATFRRVLGSIEPDAFGRRTYTLAYLVDRMKAARCAAAPRTIQSYLKALRDAGEITAHDQIGGNGSPYAVLTRCFGGADNSQKRVETAPESPTIGGADQIADERILVPQNAETPPQCKEDHQNPGAPADAPGGASYEPGRDWTAGGRLDLSGWRDPRAMRVPEEWIDRLPSPRPRRQPRQKGQRTIEAELREPMAERQARERNARIDRLAANIARAEAAGQQPAKRAERLAGLRAQGAKLRPSDPLIPTPYRPRAGVVLETLPEPPAAAAPAGAQGVGDPLQTTLSTTPLSLLERLRSLKREREAASI